MEGLSGRLHKGIERLAGQPVSLRRIAALHGASAPGALLVILAVPCVLPVPGAGSVLSIGIAALAWMLWLGRPRLVLPWRVGRWQLSPRTGARVLATLASIYGWAARFSRPRWCALAHARQRWWTAPMVAVMAGVIFLPIPFGNVLPALALVLLGLGLMFRDGLLVAGSVLVALLALAWLALLVVLGVDLGAALLDAF